MVILSLSPPVDRPGLFVQDMSQVSAVGEVYSPALGLQWVEDEWIPTIGPDNVLDAEPNSPKRPFGSVPCTEACYLFGGFSLAACLARCRR
jgi:hypothetical protein